MVQETISRRRQGGWGVTRRYSWLLGRIQRGSFLLGGPRVAGRLRPGVRQRDIPAAGAGAHRPALGRPWQQPPVQPGTAPRPSAAAARAARRSANRTPCSARTAPRRVRLSGGAGGARPPRHGLNAWLPTVTSPSAAGSKGLQIDTVAPPAPAPRSSGGLRPVNTTRSAPPRARQPPRPAEPPAPLPTPAPGHAQPPLLLRFGA